MHSNTNKKVQPISLQEQQSKKIESSSKNYFNRRSKSKNGYHRKHKSQNRSSSIYNAASIYVKDPSLIPDSQIKALIKQRNKRENHCQADSNLLKKLNAQLSKREERNKIHEKQEQMIQNYDIQQSSEIVKAVETSQRNNEINEQTKKKKKISHGNWRSKNILKLDILKTIYHPKSQRKNISEYLDEPITKNSNKQSYQKLINSQKNKQQGSDQNHFIVINHSSLRVQRRSSTANPDKNKTLSYSIQKVDMITENRKTGTSFQRYDKSEHKDKQQTGRSSFKISKNFSKFNFDMQMKQSKTRSRAQNYLQPYKFTYKPQKSQIQLMKLSSRHISPSSSQSSISTKKCNPGKKNSERAYPSRSPSIKKSHIYEDEQKIQKKHRKLKRTYIVNQQKEILIDQYLSSKGWKPVTYKLQNFTLKWTSNDEYTNYELLERTNNKCKIAPYIYAPSKMYYNHIKNNNLTTKDGLHEIVKKLNASGVRTDSFIPQTYTFQEKFQFIRQYEKNVIRILIRKYFEYLKLEQVEYKFEQIQQISKYACQLYKQSKIKCQNQALDSQCNNPHVLIQYFNPNMIVSAKNTCQFKTNIPMIFYLIILGLEIWINTEGAESDDFQCQYHRICRDQHIMANFIKFAKVQLKLNEYHDNNHIKMRKKTKKRDCDSKFIRQKTKLIFKDNFDTPSQFLKNAIKLLNSYFNASYKHQDVGDNTWIVKPSAGSKGAGIQIISKPEKINQILNKSTGSKIIQKYIENVWILNENLLQRIKGQNYQNKDIDIQIDEKQTKYNKLKNHKIFNKKFDVRQWVLLIPPKSYIFSHFYLKICSQNYDLHDFTQLSSHLSNYSINKEDFKLSQSESQSVMSQQQFQTILKDFNLSQKYLRLKLQIQQRISCLVQEALGQCKWIDGTFQIIGFDLILDENLNPWIIQCNMSPACDLRTQWLRQMREQSIKSCLHLTMPQQLNTKNDQSREYKSQYYWKQMPNEFIRCNQNNLQTERGKIEDLVIIGRKQKIKK